MNLLTCHRLRHQALLTSEKTKGAPKGWGWRSYGKRQFVQTDARLWGFCWEEAAGG